LFCCVRYGGLSFGQQYRLMASNVTEMRHLLERMTSSLAMGRQLFNNVTDDAPIQNVIDDIFTVLGRLVTRKNVKVSSEL